MHYSLQEQSTPQKVSTLGDFMEFLKRNSSLKKVESLPPEECSVCSNNKLDVIKISKQLLYILLHRNILELTKIARGCKVSPYPCEGHECACFTEVGMPPTQKDASQSPPNSTLTNVNNNSTETSTHTTNENINSNTTIVEPQKLNPSPTLPTIAQYFPACYNCIATVLYSKTNSFMRDNGRWRANCPFCKGTLKKKK